MAEEHSDATFGSEANDQFQMPERFVGKTPEEIARSYVELEQMNGRQMQELEPLIQYNQQLQPYGGIQALVDAYSTTSQNLQQIQQAYNQLLQQQGQQQMNGNNPRQTQQGESGQWDSDWDYLSPREQAARMREQIRQEILGELNPQLQDMYGRAQQQINGANESLLRQFEVYRNVMDLKQKYPDVDQTQLLQEAVRLTQAAPQDLMQVALQGIINKDGKQTEREAQRLFEQYKADLELQRKNEELNTVINGNGGGAIAQQFRGGQDERPKTDEQLRAAVFKDLLENHRDQFSPAHLQRDF